VTNGSNDLTFDSVEPPVDIFKNKNATLTVSKEIIVIYATRVCVNWAFLIVRGTGLKHERSEGFKASRAIRKAQFTQKRVAYKILLFETTSLKLPNLLKMV
jgi:hypothetical protein